MLLSEQSHWRTRWRSGVGINIIEPTKGGNIQDYLRPLQQGHRRTSKGQNVYRMSDLLCPEHGGLSHLFLHEAAHAVAAIDRGIGFTHVRVLPPDEQTQYGGGFVGGGVWLSDPDPTTSVAPNPAAALEFALAGSVAEKLAFGHCLDRSYEGDFDWWRCGAGLVDSTTLAEIETALGRPMAVVRSDTRRWVTSRYPAIRAVVVAMTGVDPRNASTVHIDQCRSLTEAEVRALM